MAGCQLGLAVWGSHGHTGVGARVGGSRLCQDQGHGLGAVQALGTPRSCGLGTDPATAPQQFHEAAYLADDRHDLLNAINEFLDCSVVLPPSEVQGEELLRSVAHFQREMLKKRMEQERRLLLEPKSPEEKGDKGRAGAGAGFGGVPQLLGSHCLSVCPSACPQRC